MKPFGLAAVAATAICAAGSAQALAVNVQTQNRTDPASPAANGSGGASVSASGDAVTFGGDGALAGSAISASRAISPSPPASARDITGFVLAWTDPSDHDRLGREGGGDSDPSTIFHGLWFPRPLAGREAAGVSTRLFDIAGLYRARNADYDVALTRTGADPAFSAVQGASTVGSGATADATSPTGAVGVQVEGNASPLTDIAVAGPAAAPVPAALALMLGGLGAFALIRRRR